MVTGMHFKVGDIVRVKDNAYDLDGNGIGFATAMKEYCGKTFVVKYVTDEETPAAYHLEGCSDETDGYDWWFAENWLDYYDENEYSDIDEARLEEVFHV